MRQVEYVRSVTPLTPSLQPNPVASSSVVAIPEAAENVEAPTKKPRFSLYAGYDRGEKNTGKGKISLSPSLVLSYINCIEAGQICTWQDVLKQGYDGLYPLMERIYCTPASSAPVERIFSQSGLFMRPHRARMGDKNLCRLVYIKCNKHVK